VLALSVCRVKATFNTSCELLGDCKPRRGVVRKLGLLKPPGEGVVCRTLPAMVDHGAGDPLTSHFSLLV